MSLLVLKSVLTESSPDSCTGNPKRPGWAGQKPGSQVSFQPWLSTHRETCMSERTQNISVAADQIQCS